MARTVNGLIVDSKSGVELYEIEKEIREIMAANAKNKERIQ